MQLELRFFFKSIIFLFKVLLLTSILVGCSSLTWKKSFSEHSSKSVAMSDSIINKILGHYNNIIIHNVSLQWSDRYNILAKKNKKWYSIQYILNKDAITTNEPPFHYTTNHIQKNIGDSIWKVFIKHEFWKIQSEDNGDCVHNKNGKGCFVDDGKWERLIMILGKRRVDKKYYEPMFYEQECCPGSENRKVFIVCTKALEQLSD